MTMPKTLPPVNGVMAFSCQGEVHDRCSGAWWSFTRNSRVACGCDCHVFEPGQQAFDFEAAS